tara:strand:+ start:98 stop:1033 length:936 start_codon:yes stop_codon:yes gene_type:complete
MIWIIGSGQMAKEYVKVLKALNKKFLVIGKSIKKANYLKREESVEVISGGVEKFLLTNPTKPSNVIICTQIENLFIVSKSLIKYGIKNLLIEKPASINIKEIRKLSILKKKYKLNIFVAYNRRFYSSYLYLQNKLKKEKLLAIQFEITEWANTIEDANFSNEVKQKWVLSNTSHVIDMVLNLSGDIKKLETFNMASLKWHKSSSRFAGAGISKSNVLLSYIGCWDSPGRFSVEVFTNKCRYIFKPLEKIKVQKMNSIEINDVKDVNYELDNKFKPGLFLQTKNFLLGKDKRLCSIDQHLKNFHYYNQIANY